MGFFSHAKRDGYYVSYGPSRTRAKYVCTPIPDHGCASTSQGRVATITRQTCASCGKFRSSKWEAAHPLTPGVPARQSICGRCQHDKTSSEEKEPRRYRCNRRKSRHRHHHSRRCTETTDDSYCSIRDRRSPRRYQSDSRDYSRPRASSRDGVRIVIANQPGERKARVSTQSSSTEGVRVIRRTSYVEIPERGRSRSRARSSSRAHYLADGTAQYHEDLIQPRHPRYRSKPRSLSRSSCIEEFIRPRRRRSSTSHVQFVDDFEEPVVVSKSPRRISRRRAVYFDGAVSDDLEEHEDQDRSPSRSSQLRARVSGDVEEHESQDPARSRSSQPQSEISEQPSDSKIFIREREPPSCFGFSSSALEDAMDPHDRSNQKGTTQHVEAEARHQGSLKDAGTQTSYKTGSPLLQKSEQYKSDSSHEATPYLGFRHVERGSVPVTRSIPKANGQGRLHSDSGDSGLGLDSSTVSEHHATTAHTLYEPGPSYHKRRRKFRDDSSDDDDDVANTRRVRARAPSGQSSRPRSEYLSEMLQSAYITPPNSQPQAVHECEPPSPLRSRSTSRSGGFDNRAPSPWREPISPQRSRSTSRSEGFANHPPSTWGDVAAEPPSAYRFRNTSRSERFDNRVPSTWGEPPSPLRSRSTSRAEAFDNHPPSTWGDAPAAETEYVPPPYQDTPVYDLYGNRVDSYDYRPAPKDPKAQQAVYEGWGPPQSPPAYEYNWMT